MNLIKIIFASLKTNDVRDELFKELNKTDNIEVVCRTLKFGSSLILITSKKILDVEVKNIELMEAGEFHNLIWNLVHCQSITLKTKKSLFKFVGNIMPVYERPSVSTKGLIKGVYIHLAFQFVYQAVLIFI